MVRTLVRLVALVAIVASIAMGLALPSQAAPPPNPKPAAEIQVCKNGICDGRDPATVPANRQRYLQPVVQWNRKIDLVVDDSADPMGWANISNGLANDEVWLDRSFDGGSTWESALGYTKIPAGQTSWRTLMFWANDVGRAGLLRACGKAGDRPEVACTAWLPICRSGVCDGADPSRATATKTVGSAWQWNRRIDLNVTYGVGGGMAWANISNANAGDQVWIDRSGNGGAGWSGHLGDAYTPSGWTSWRTWMYSLVSLGSWQIRACGKAGDRPEVSCTGWLPVCDGGLCDGQDPAGSAEKIVQPLGWVWWRKISLHIRSDSRMAWAEIGASAHPGEGSERDEVWIDRSWQSGNPTQWDGPLGHTSIPAGGKSWRTWMFTFNDPSHGGTGQLRACGKARDTTEIDCTPWVRATTPQPVNMHHESVHALADDYDTGAGKWEPEPGYWMSGTALTSMLDYMIRTGNRDSRFLTILNNTRAKHAPDGIPDHPGVDDYYDDFAWWALAWVRAYDLTGDAGYLTLAEGIANQIRGQWNGACGGGIRWRNVVGENIKNTITNGLYIKLAAQLYLRGRTGGPGWTWQSEAQDTWNWFRTSVAGNLLKTSGPNPGVVKDAVQQINNVCTYWNEPIGSNEYTYLQGVLPGGLGELYRITRDPEVLRWANGIASATTTNSNGKFRDPRAPEVLYYGPEEADEGLNGNGIDASDGTAFKGAFIRGLRELYDVNVQFGQPTGNWRQFILDQRNSVLSRSRGGWVEWGMHWSGPVRHNKYLTFGSQLSGIDALNAAVGL